MNTEPDASPPKSEIPAKTPPTQRKKSLWEVIADWRSWPPQVPQSLIGGIFLLVVSVGGWILLKPKSPRAEAPPSGISITATGVSNSSVAGVTITGSNSGDVITVGGTGNTVNVHKSGQIITNVVGPERLKKLPPNREKEYRAEVASDFANYDKVMAKLRELGFAALTREVVTNLLKTNALTHFDTNVLVRLYFREIQAPINQYLATTNFNPQFRARYNKWVQLPDRMQVQAALIELAAAWDEKITNGKLPSDPTIRKANFESLKQMLLEDAIGIIEGKLANAESDFETWTTEYLFQEYLKLYGE